MPPYEVGTLVRKKPYAGRLGTFHVPTIPGVIKEIFLYTDDMWASRVAWFYKDGTVKTEYELVKDLEPFTGEENEV